MPYNTRRKSLSLSSLGIHVPVTQAARAAAVASAAAAAAASPSPSSSAPASAAPTPSDTPRSNSQRQYGTGVAQRRHISPDQPQSKRIKRWHNDEAEATTPATTSAVRPSVEPRDYEHTPPPSPDAESPVLEIGIVPIDHDDASPRRNVMKKRVSLEEINDEIVEAVVSQLVATGNRPHLIKELAAVLSQRLPIVQHSANPCAIISSRLSTFLKRPCWTSLAPCPLGKELETVHPRRTYFFLTTRARQALPTATSVGQVQQPLPLASRTSPSISSEGLPLDLADAEARRQVSPSPEVDLSSPELDDMDENIDSPTTSASPVRHMPIMQRERRSRGTSPPLEKDEREFTQTANGLQKRKIGTELAATESIESAHSAPGLDESLFCDTRTASYSLAAMTTCMVVSPTMKPSHPTASIRRDLDGETWLKLGGLLDWDQMPENMELEELDCLFESC